MALFVAYPAFGDLSINGSTLSLDLDLNMPWEEYLVPGPAVISLLGQLMVISGKIDFSLIENAPRDGFKYMRYPESFRASLVQVSNDGWSAFMNAHKNMDKIQLYMQQVPIEVKSALKILSQPSSRLIERLLPRALTRIQQIGHACVELAAETGTKFSDVMLLLGELLAVTESSRGTHGQKLREVQAELNVTATMKVEMEKIGVELKKRQQDLEAEVKKYRAKFDSALRNIPSSWSCILQEIVHAGVRLVSMDFLSGGGSGGVSAGGGLVGGAATPDFAKSEIFSVMGSFFGQVGKIKDAVVKLFDGKGPSDGNPSGIFSTFSTAIGSLENVLKSGPISELGSKALNFIKDGKNICNDLERMFSGNTASSLNQSDQAQVMQYLNSLQDKMAPIVAEGSGLSGGVATGEGTKPTAACENIDFKGPGGNERFEACLAKEALRDAENRYDQIFGELMKYHEEMAQLMGKMASLNLQEISFTEILELLKQGIQILAKIREHWSSLVQFFAALSLRAEVVLNDSFDKFVYYAEQAEDMIGYGDITKEEREFFRGDLEEQAARINKVRDGLIHGYVTLSKASPVLGRLLSIHVV